MCILNYTVLILICPLLHIVVSLQSLYGRNAFQRHIFQMFESTGDHDLLFGDDTKCLVKIGQKITLKEYLGEKYPAILRI